MGLRWGVAGYKVGYGSGHRAPKPKTPTAGAGGRIVVPTEFLSLLGTHTAFNKQSIKLCGILPNLLTFIQLYGII